MISSANKVAPSEEMRIVIFGNSGSGKSTVARTLSEKYDLSHLDLDTLAWTPTTPPHRKPILDSKEEMDLFIKKNPNWVIEGCYSDLIECIILQATEVIYMDLPDELCVQNAKNRPWEPHKYKSKEDQDENLAMLIEWIRNYSTRTDTFSKEKHEALFKNFMGTKRKISNNNYKL